jgi:hypothetical protein
MIITGHFWTPCRAADSFSVPKLLPDVIRAKWTWSSFAVSSEFRKHAMQSILLCRMIKIRVLIEQT